MSPKFLEMNYSELGHFKWLIEHRRITSDDVQFLWEWVTGEREKPWSSQARDIILWLEKMPYQ